MSLAYFLNSLSNMQLEHFQESAAAKLKLSSGWSAGYLMSGLGV